MTADRTRIRTLFALVLILFGTTVLTGCSKSDSDGTIESFDPDKPVKLKIMFSDSNYFHQRYGNMLAVKYPNIEFEVLTPPVSSEGVTTAEDTLQQIRDNSPDIINVSSPFHEKLAADGQLVDLDPLIRQDGFDIEDIHPSVIESIRGGEGGKLYGLAPSFSANALYYNVDLFRKHGIDLPADKMSWEDTLKLAMRFPSDGTDGERVYGFQTGIMQNFAGFVRSVAEDYGLTPISADGKTVVVHSDGWRSIIENALLARDSLLMARGATTQELFDSSLFSPGEDPFLNGRVAMKIGHFGLYQDFENAKRLVQNYSPFEWGVVTVPVNPSTPDTAKPLLLGSIYSINRDSAHKSAAWEVIKYINGEEIARLESGTHSSDIPARKAYATKSGELNVEPFFALKPAVKKWNLKTTRDESASRFFELFSRQLDEVIAGGKTLDEALQTIQSEGEQLLTANGK
ncbi:hypothetical protein B1A99_07530 [Cohnella sp. CIP 111063]|uniref:ABC transporter substrate-binding protein n=1 Tax=unclassified Cohnella TaxID=2636738 RepID=UPI000B8C674B|nr:MULTISPECIES: extracellular solute-binding protein [unclassified Cohnella]OXS60285.1 hypothetical protein B1A99_07530 [Cohnella sp. CIP 111063]PRX72968.1 multiple sugar transport system substrate-binding protein [Cohnella sp. SGD-V74]